MDANVGGNLDVNVLALGVVMGTLDDLALIRVPIVIVVVLFVVRGRGFAVTGVVSDFETDQAEDDGEEEEVEDGGTAHGTETIRLSEGETPRWG